MQFFFVCRYIPVGVLEQLPQKINERPPYYVGRNDLETLMSSPNCGDWVRLRWVHNFIIRDLCETFASTGSIIYMLSKNSVKLRCFDRCYKLFKDRDSVEIVNEFKMN